MSDPARDELFIKLATSAFKLGLEDGRSRGGWGGSGPRTGYELMSALVPHIPDIRVFHRQKLRQVYGAGFDIAKYEALSR